MIEKQVSGGILLTMEPTPLPDVLAEPIKKRWCMDEEDTTVDELLAKAAAIANPGVFLRAAQVESVEGDRVVLGGQLFVSSLVAQKLHTPGMTAVGYVMTSGCALYQERQRLADDFILGVIWDEICIAYLRMAGDLLHKYVMKHYFPSEDHKKKYAALNPGSLAAWPIRAQMDLFSYLGEGPKLVGVELTDSMLMVPTKSGSGIFFPTEHAYENCMHCPRIDCPNRRAPYQGE